MHVRRHVSMCGCIYVYICECFFVFVYWYECWKVWWYAYAHVFQQSVHMWHVRNMQLFTCKSSTIYLKIFVTKATRSMKKGQILVCIMKFYT
uniref:Secreted protein n=1 Tax=Parascaris univalens TaxID=6257 RepID=A0A915AKF8_PARUN